jgi:hypothetical protein
MCVLSYRNQNIGKMFTSALIRRAAKLMDLKAACLHTCNVKQVMW